ncbi:hypothetical protein, partial [Pelagicoccus sp. SDUM812005]|uniref:hypothetical protein n=1 Tax=Pelagicoccus sp. SDUM812005 TaxID=3041257 RepID=UPI00280C98BD
VGQRKMKRLKWTAAIILVVTAYSAFSYYRATQIEKKVLIPALNQGVEYERKVSFGLVDPTVSWIPFWRIFYSPKKENSQIQSERLFVDYVGRIVDWSSKEVRIEMMNHGYADEY